MKTAHRKRMAGDDGRKLAEQTREVIADPERAEQLRQGHMIPRLRAPKDIAWAALYLASDEASWVTASDIRVDGGATQW